MTVPRLRVLLAHHEPVEAYAVAIGRSAPHPRVAPAADADDPSGLAGVCLTVVTPTEWATRCRHHGIRVISTRDDGLPGGARQRSGAAGGLVRPRRSGRARPPPCRGRRHPQRHAGRTGHRRSSSATVSPRPASSSSPVSPRVSTARLTPVRCGAAVGRPSRSSATVRTSRTRGFTPGSGRTCAAAGCSCPSGRLARPRAVPLPVAQPHPGRAQRGARRGREPRARRLPDHRASGHRALDRRHGGARLGPQPGRRGHQPAAPRRRRPVTSVDDVLVALGLDTRRAGHAGLRPSATAARHRRRSAGAVPAGPVHARRGRRRAGSVDVATRRWRSPASSGPGGFTRPAAGSSRWCHGRGRHERIPSLECRDALVDSEYPRRGGVGDDHRFRTMSADERARQWLVEPFARSLSSLSGHTVDCLRLGRSWLRRVGGAAGRRGSGGGDPHDRSSLSRLPHDEAVRAAEHRQEDGRPAAVLPLVGAGRPTHARPDERACRPRVATVGCPRCSTGAISTSCSVAGLPDDEPVWRRRRDDAVLEILYGSGLRVGELCGLDTSSIDLDAGRRRRVGQGLEATPRTAVGAGGRRAAVVG